jgi:hypothetical protein
MTYAYEVKNTKTFRGNVVIQLNGNYYAIREPDAGLSIPDDQKSAIVSVTINPTTVDFKKANQTVSSYSFRILDKNLLISKELEDNATLFLGAEVRIWIGRSGVAMDFADYFELPRVFVNKLSHADNTYNFSCKDTTDRVTKAVYNLKTLLQADITNATTAFLVESTSGFESSGYLKLDDEVVSFGTTIADQFQTVVRGEFGTIPVEHDFGTEIYELTVLNGNPIDLILQVLTSTGAGTNGAYDVLPKGLGVTASLVDIAEIEAIRDDFFPTDVFTLYAYDIENTLRFLEEELFQATGTRLITNSNQKISLAILDQTSFDEALNNPIGEESINAYPQWEVELNDIISTIKILYDYDEQSGKYQYTQTFFEPDTETNFGKIKPLEFKFKGIRDADNGDAIVNILGTRLLARFSTARPEVSISTHIDKSLLNIGDKVLLTSSQIPSGSGSLQFAESMEIVSRSINYLTGDVKFKLQFTSYAGIRGSYIGPTAAIDSVITQSKVEFPAGLADNYEIGWKLRLWNTLTNQYESDDVNTVLTIDGDEVEFVDSWTTVLNTSVHRFRFADYDDAAESQKKYAFVGKTSGVFDDGAGSYKIGL